MKKLMVVMLAIGLLAMTGNKKTRIVFFGDSITQMGVNENGYIDVLKKQIQEHRLQDKYELIGAGIGGNKVYDLYLRLEKDVLKKQPDVVMIYIGINDVWHKTSGVGTDIGKYEQFYRALIDKMQAKKIKVVLATPTVIGEKKDGTNPQDEDLTKYAAVVRKLATEYKLSLVDLRKAFMDYESQYNAANKESGILTTDRVHLNDTGNKLVAAEINKILSLTP